VAVPIEDPFALPGARRPREIDPARHEDERRQPSNEGKETRSTFDDDHAAPPAALDDDTADAIDAVDAGIDDLLAGTSPVNMIHGAIELDGSASHAPRPSQAGIDAARNEILAALWGLDL
jgi:hypothetical protein